MQPLNCHETAFQIPDRLRFEASDRLRFEALRCVQLTRCLPLSTLCVKDSLSTSIEDWLSTFYLLSASETLCLPSIYSQRQRLVVYLLSTLSVRDLLSTSIYSQY